MDRRTIIIITTAVAILLIGGGAYWYFSKKTVAPTQGIVSVFPKGSSGFLGSGTTGGGLPITSSPATIPFVAGSGAPTPRLYELHKAPIAGVGFFETGKKTDLSISARYIERGLGNIFETPLATLTESRISNETRPRIVEAFWGNVGKSAVIRYLDQTNGGIIKTKILNLIGQATLLSNSTSTQNVFVKTEEISLPDDIPFVSTAGDNSDKLFYLSNGSASVLGWVTSFKNIGALKIFSSSFTEWLPQFPNKNLVTLTTKPSMNIAGHMFFISPTTKTVTKILGNINGLTTLTSPDGKLVLYSETQDNKPSVSIYDVVKKETHPLPIQTLPEKCVWSNKKTTIAYCAVPQYLPTGEYPDQWYQGILSFSDDLWVIDGTNQNASRVMSPGDFGVSGIDMINLSVSSDDSYLLFMNKVSGTPWMYRITDTQPTAPAPTITSQPQQKQTAPTYTAPTPSTSGGPIPLPPAITPDMQKIK